MWTRVYYRCVPDLGIGWSTELAVLTLSGSRVEDHGDHLVVRTPANPTYHWGNCILVTDPAGADDAGHWLHAFETTFPSANWVAIGLPRMPTDSSVWTARELSLEPEAVLVSLTPPSQSVPPHGYTVRRLNGTDWEQHLVLDAAENEWAWDSEAGAYTSFARARNESRRAMGVGDIAAYFGAFADGSLAASLGIVRCGTTGRYQDVLTATSHRRRGLASHLLGVAARWAGSHGCDRWVVVTEATNPAGRVYERAGLEPHSTRVSAYRRDAT